MGTWTLTEVGKTNWSGHLSFIFHIERLRLMSQAVKHSQHSLLYFVSLIRLQGKK